MAKTKEDLEVLKKEYEDLTNKLKGLNEEELQEISSGVNIWDIAVKQKETFNNHD